MTTAREGSYINALNQARKAEELEPSRGRLSLVGRKTPSRPGTRLTSGAAGHLCRGTLARPGSRRSDRIMERSSRLRSGRWTQPCSRMLLLNGTQTSQGMVLSVTCAKEGTAVVVQMRTGQSTFSSFSGARMVGYSDTLVVRRVISRRHHLDNCGSTLHAIAGSG